MIRKLYQLRNGQSGFVAAIAATGERAQRFRDMGLLPGVGITVMGRSPMGGSPVPACDGDYAGATCGRR